MVDGFSARIGNAIATLDPNSANHGALLQIMEEAATSFASVAGSSMNCLCSTAPACHCLQDGVSVSIYGAAML